MQYSQLPNMYEAPYGTKLILFYRRDVFHSDSHFTNRNDGFYLSQWWTLLIELKVSIISIAFLSIDRCTHRNFHIDRTIKKHRLIDVMYRSIDTKKGPSIDTKGPSIDTKQWRGGYLLTGGALAYFGAPPPTGATRKLRSYV